MVGPEVLIAVVHDSEADFLSLGGTRVLSYYDIPGSVRLDADPVQYR